MGYVIILMFWVIPRNALIFNDFHFSSTYFNKNNMKFVISNENWICKHVVYIFLTKKNFSKKILGLILIKYFKKKFCAEISLFIHQSTQFFTEITNFILVLLENLAKRIKTAKYRSLKGGGVVTPQLPDLTPPSERACFFTYNLTLWGYLIRACSSYVPFKLGILGENPDWREGSPHFEHAELNLRNK